MSQPWAVKPGGLSDADHLEIESLANRGWKASRIARRIEKNSGTVYWYMLQNGLTESKGNHCTRPYTRKGKLVYPFTRKEDAFIQALRVQDFDFSEIAKLATKKFNKPRTGHSVYVRLVMLATREETGGDQLEQKPRFNLEAQVATLGADSLLPDYRK